MKFETVRIYFLIDFLGLLSSNNFATMATWLNNFSPLLSLNLHAGAVNRNFQRDGEGEGGLQPVNPPWKKCRYMYM